MKFYIITGILLVLALAGAAVLTEQEPDPKRPVPANPAPQAQEEKALQGLKIN